MGRGRHTDSQSWGGERLFEGERKFLEGCRRQWRRTRRESEMVQNLACGFRGVDRCQDAEPASTTIAGQNICGAHVSSVRTTDSCADDVRQQKRRSVARCDLEGPHRWGLGRMRRLFRTPALLPLLRYGERLSLSTLPQGRGSHDSGRNERVEWAPRHRAFQ